MNIATRLSSSALRKPVGASTSDLIGGSTQCWRGKSYAAAAAAAQEPSDFPKKRSGRVPREERKAMLECYVNKYREINPGKFPTPSEAVKQVGGNYYAIKKLIQELQYQAKISSMSKVETQGEVMKDVKTLSGPHHLSISNMKIHKNICQDGQTTETRDQNLSLKDAGTISSVKLDLVVTAQEENPMQRHTQASPETESDKTDESFQEVEEIKLFQSDKKIAENSCESGVGSDLPKPTKNAESLYEKMQVSELDNLEPDSEPGQLHQAQKLGTVTRELPKHHADDAEVEKKSNMWDDLKSFADGIISFFKNR